MRPAVVLATLLLSGVLATGAAAAAVLPAPPPRGFDRGMSDGRLLMHPDPVRRAAAMRESAAAGATVVRLPVSWRSLFQGEVDWASPEARDPNHPAYRFAFIDNAVRSAVDAGLTPLLMVFRAPNNALTSPIWPYARMGSWAPRPAALQAFATAIARRYDGAFPDPARPGAVLPRVKLWQAWNEPNLVNYLEPQWVARGGTWAPFTPAWYRRMLNAFYAGVKSVHPDNVVAAAGIAPAGSPVDGDGRMTPLRFLHAFLCLRPPPSLRTDPTCPDAPRFDALAFHPLSTGDPDRAARSRMDVAIADLHKVTRPLEAAGRAGFLGPAPRPRLWVTELNWETGAPPGRVPPNHEYGYVSRGLERLWRAGADLITWHFLTDPPTLLDGRSRPAGLRRVAPDGGIGAPKQLLRGFRFPLVVSRRDAGTIHVWSAPPGGAPTIVLERRVGAGWRPLATWTARRVLDTDVRLPRGATLRMRSGAQYSAAVLVRAP